MHTNSTLGGFTPPAPHPHQRWDASALSLALGGDGRVSLEGRSRCPCPAHHGTGHNLWLRVTSDRRLLATCFSRTCSREEILAAIDRELGTAFSDPPVDVGKQGPRPAHFGGGDVDDAVDDNDAAVANNDEDSANADGRRPKVGVSWTATKIKKDDTAQVREKVRRIVAAATPVTSESLVACYLTEPRGITLSVIPKTHKRQGSRRHGPRFAQLCPNQHDRPDRRRGVAADPVQPAVREVVA